MKALTFISIHIGLMLLPALACAQSPAPYQYYYLSIGSGHYEQDPSRFADPGFVPFDNLPEALLSAKIMAQVFEKSYAAKAMSFFSTQNQMISKSRLLQLLQALDKRIIADKAPHPFIIFYFCGHGISENMGWNQFFVPGSYTKITANQKFDEISRQLIFLGDVTDHFRKKKYPYMALVDCCRKQSKDSSFPEKKMSYFFNEQNLETFRIVIQALKYLNEYHQSSPVVFAISPGSLAPTVPLPEQAYVTGQANGKSSVGPLCRRTLLAVQTLSAHPEKGRSVSDFVSLLTSPVLDKASPLSVSYFEANDKVTGQRLLTTP